MIIDAHHHVWTLARGWYGWLTPALGPIHRDFGPEDLAPHLAATGVERTVLVQAAPHEDETAFMIEVARRTHFVAGVVGWVDFDSPSAPARIEALSAEPLLKGLRPMIQDIPDPQWMLRPALAPALEMLARQGLTFDALVKAPQLPHLPAFLDRYPDLAVVVDHAAKPAIGDRAAFGEWATRIRAVAERERVHCKLSGLLTEAPPGAGAADLRPYVDHLLACFGPARLMWGSDWPVLELAGRYERWHAMARALVDGLSAHEQAEVFGGTAARFYRLEIVPTQAGQGT